MDLRVRYTRAVIRDAFFELLKTQDVNAITVRAICEKAQINRTTFYRYYDNPFELMNSIENELLDGLQEKINAQQAFAPKDLFDVILSGICEKRDMYLALFSANGDALFRERVFEICAGASMRTIEQLFPDMSSTEREWLYSFIAEGANGVMGRWIAGGMKETSSELTGFVVRVIESINKGLQICTE